MQLGCLSQSPLFWTLQISINFKQRTFSFTGGMLHLLRARVEFSTWSFSVSRLAYPRRFTCGVVARVIYLRTCAMKEKECRKCREFILPNSKKNHHAVYKTVPYTMAKKKKQKRGVDLNFSSWYVKRTYKVKKESKKKSSGSLTVGKVWITSRHTHCHNLLNKPLNMSDG